MLAWFFIGFACGIGAFILFIVLTALALDAEDKKKANL